MYQVKITNTVSKNIFDEETQELVEKNQETIDSEELALITAKENEIKAKVDKYKDAQEYQRKHGGSGPVADFETMKICNEYNGKFEVLFEEVEE